VFGATRVSARDWKDRHAQSDMREGRFCAILFQTARKWLILNGEMSEWLKEHAWKANRSTLTE